MIFILGGVEYDNINTYIHALSPYHNLQLKFIFTEKPNIDDEICLYYENYLLNYVACLAHDDNFEKAIEVTKNYIESKINKIEYIILVFISTKLRKKF
jgi:hypothetical protein